MGRAQRNPSIDTIGKALRWVSPRGLPILLLLFWLSAGVTTAHDVNAPGATFADCKECPEMVVIPAGANEIGSTPEERRRENVPASFGDHEGPRHLVTIAKPFAMGKNEITRGLYAKFAEETKLTNIGNCAGFDPKTDTWPIIADLTWKSPGFPQTDRDPAVCISWQDATAFAVWLSGKTGKHYRLPSEAEWEYAARAGTKTARYWGDGDGLVCENANILTQRTVEAWGSPASWKDKLVCTSDRAFTIPVGALPPNPFGLNDMLGNTWEWVADCFHETYDGAPTDGSAWDEPNCKHRIPRGGGFQSAPWLARAATRAGPPPDFREDASGIRVVRDLD